MTSRPTVLHCARDWVRPSERFVFETVVRTERTRPVVAMGSRWSGLGQLRPAGVRVHDVGRVVRPLPQRLQPRALPLLIAGVAVGARASLVHAHFGYWAAPVARAAARVRRPWLVSLHGHDLLVQAPGEPAPHPLLTAARVVVPSRYLAAAAERFGVRPDRVRVVPSGVDLATLPFEERRLRAGEPVTVTFAGRFVAKKGPLAAAEAMAAVAAGGTALRCRFVGHGPLADQLRARLRELRLAAEVVDGTDPDAVRHALAGTHLLLTPSRTAPDGDAETLGLVNVEAQACGVPVVTTRHGGIPEAVAADAGVLVAEGDPRALAAALQALVDAPDRWPGMGRAGRAYVAAHFDLRRQVAALEDVYAELLGS